MLVSQVLINNNSGRDNVLLLITVALLRTSSISVNIPDVKVTLLRTSSISVHIPVNKKVIFSKIKTFFFITSSTAKKFGEFLVPLISNLPIIDMSKVD